MAKNNRPDVYKGRRKKLNVLGIVLSALALLIVAAFVVFGAFQKYIVYANNGISLELPILATSSPGSEQGEDGGQAQTGAELEITEPSYSDIESMISEELEPIRAVFVPADQVTPESIGAYVSAMENAGCNALVLELKPPSGQLVWASSSQTAQDYGTSGTVDLSALVSELKAKELYLIGQLCCCTDDLFAQRCPSAALGLPSGTSFSNEEGYWLDPYNSQTSAYLRELCSELAGLGFDELLLKNMAMPVTDAPILYTVQLSSEPNPASAVCGLAMDLRSELANTDVKLSAILVSTALRASQSSQAGQDLSVFCKLFDRLYCAADSVWQGTVDRSSVDYWMYDGDIALRFIPILPYMDDSGTFTNQAYRVPEGLI